jgi:DNA polymerase
MSDQTQTTDLDELRSIVDETQRHLKWLADAGIRTVIRPDFSSGSLPAPMAGPPAASSPARARPSFLSEPPPARPPPAPVVMAPPVAPPVAATLMAAPPAARPLMPVESAPSIVPVAARPFALLETVGSAASIASLQVIRDELGDCRRCGLCATRKNIVFGQGGAGTDILFLGEGPGEDEDESGLAFVGRAGQLLTKMIEAMGYARSGIYICNIVKCRPPGNRRPEPAEVEACRPFYEQQIRALRPKVVVALGATAAHALLKTNTPISLLRNQWSEWEGIPVMATFHPAYLLRAPQEKAKAWDDLKLVMARLGKERPAR